LIDKFGWHNRVDFERVRRAVLEQSGVPIDVTLLEGNDLKDEVLQPQSAPRQALHAPTAAGRTP